MLWLAFTSTWFVFIIAFAEGESNPLIWRGTKWCGIGSSKSGEETRNITETDLCCKEHDACPLYIPRWQLKYNYFNWRLYTVSSCGCDDKFRKCLQNQTSVLSQDIKVIYFHMLKVPCFEMKFKKTKKCVAWHWYLKCKEYKMQMIPFAQIRG